MVRRGTGPSGGSAQTKVPTRFHASKDVTVERVVRDVGQLCEEICLPLRYQRCTGKDIDRYRVVELDKVTEDQPTAIRENLNTLGFKDHDWSMD